MAEGFHEMKPQIPGSLQDYSGHDACFGINKIFWRKKVSTARLVGNYYELGSIVFQDTELHVVDHRPTIMSFLWAGI